MNTIPSVSEKTTAGLTRPVLAEAGIECTILALGPGESVVDTGERDTHEHVLFVIEGGALVRRGEFTFMLRPDDALHIPAGREHTIVSDADRWTKVLRIAFAPRVVPNPPLYSFPD
jgi:mannose-6-phosphate isomerase-like protein (cupin superfamily)